MTRYDCRTCDYMCPECGFYHVGNYYPERMRR